MVPRKPCKKKVVPLAMFLTILIIKEKEVLYIEIHHSDKDTVNTNYTFF